MGTNDISGPSRAVPDISAVTVTVPEPETVVFCQNHGEPKPQYFWS